MSDDGRQRTAGRTQRSEVGGQKSEIRGQKALGSVVIRYSRDLNL